MNFTIPNIKGNLNIRTAPDKESDILGKLPAESFAYVLATEGDWVKISTGSIKTGYVNAKYLFSEEKIKELCDDKKWISATINVSVLNVRSGPSTDTDIVDKLKKGEKVTVLLSKSFNEWLAIQLDKNTVGYISSKYATICYNLKTGASLEEIEEFLKDHKDVAIYYVVLDKSDANQTSELVSLVALEYTPTTFLIVDGGTQDSFVGVNDGKLAGMISILK